MVLDNKRAAIDKVMGQMRDMTYEDIYLTAWDSMVDKEMRVSSHYYDNSISQIDDSVNNKNEVPSVCRHIAMALLITVAPVIVTAILYVAVMALPIDSLLVSSLVVWQAASVIVYMILERRRHER